MSSLARILAAKPPVDPTVYVFAGVACRRLPLTHEQYALVDESDYAELSRFNWSAKWAKNTQSWYAVRTVGSGKEKRTVYLHKTLMRDGAIPGDHQNRVTLDCRRDNLRPASALENGQNKKKRCDNASGFIGVYAHKPGIWRARGQSKVGRKSLGLYRDPALAARRYDQWAVETYGAFANLNFSEAA
jgi:hypothetical protein